jgi:hypothetical protein
MDSRLAFGVGNLSQLRLLVAWMRVPEMELETELLVEIINT